jgi:secreted trypsin-like serine protease
LKIKNYLGEFPWLVPIFYMTFYHCGSSVITSNFVLTAAHCIHPKNRSVGFDTNDFSVHVGKFNLENANEKFEIIKAAEIIINFEWNSNASRYDGDVALIKLEQGMEFSQFVKQIALPHKNFLDVTVNGYVVGYGKSERPGFHETIPRLIQIPSVKTETCYQSNGGFASLKSENSFCAGKPGTIPCKGKKRKRLNFITLI